jgi:oligopeptide/dipeptide ABC transporter ATP-binding protein
VTVNQVEAAPEETSGDPALQVSGLSVTAGEVPVLHDVSFSIAPGERVGLIGESGSGKSLTALSVMGLLPEGVEPTGSVRLAGVRQDLLTADERLLSRLRGDRLAMVFQEPMTALNPTATVGAQVMEAVRIHDRTVSRAGARLRALALLEQVHVPSPPRVLRSFPHQLSGGQRQRVVLAMALAHNPALLLCDEPTTALDVTVQAQMLALIDDGVRENGTALLFITHDLAVVATLCERVLVMYGGRVVESGPTREVLTRPRHPYTRGLLYAADLERAGYDNDLPTIPGTVPAAGRFPQGCVFRNRCDRSTDRCVETPAWSGSDSTGHACWHPVEDP